MKEIFRLALEGSIQKSLSATDSELFSASFPDQIYKQHQIQTPYLDKENTSVQIGSEIIDFDNAPDNVSFTPGSEMEYALFSVPIKGNLDLFRKISRSLSWGRSRFISGSSFCYKEISPENITNNQSVIALIKGKAQRVITGVQALLDQFKQQADQFNESELMPMITKTIDEERQNRKQKGDSENKLKPFQTTA
jgi:hypothetical protein